MALSIQVLRISAPSALSIVVTSQPKFVEFFPFWLGPTSEDDEGEDAIRAAAGENLDVGESNDLMLSVEEKGNGSNGLYVASVGGMVFSPLTASSICCVVTSCVLLEPSLVLVASVVCTTGCSCRII